MRACAHACMHACMHACHFITSILPAYKEHVAASVKTRNGSLLQYLSCHSMQFRWKYADKVQSRASRPACLPARLPAGLPAGLSACMGACLRACLPACTRAPQRSPDGSTRPAVTDVVLLLTASSCAHVVPAAPSSSRRRRPPHASTPLPNMAGVLRRHAKLLPHPTAAIIRPQGRYRQPARPRHLPPPPQRATTTTPPVAHQHARLPHARYPFLIWQARPLHVGTPPD